MKPHPKSVIHMLGSFQVVQNGVTVSAHQFGSRKARDLLRWLADARNTVIHRDVLLDALWPGMKEEQVLASFRVRISELRKLLSPDEKSPVVLDRIDNGYILHTIPGYLETDVDHFEHLASKALTMASSRDALPLLQKCIKLYRGDYFSDDPYTAQWYGTRERYRNMFLTVAHRLAQIHESMRQFQDGIFLLERLLGDDYREEGLYRALIRLQYLQGDQAGALRTFQQCREYIQSELETHPMPETLLLFKQVMRGEPLDVAPPPDDAKWVPPQNLRRTGRHRWPFLGRQAELEQLKEMIASLRQGQGSIAWLYGSPGIGKTRLLREALEKTMEKGGLRTIWMQGSRLNASIPFATALDGLQAGIQPDLTADEINSLMDSTSPELQQLTGWYTDPSPRRMLRTRLEPETMGDVLLRQEILTLLKRLSKQSPLIICVDDAHAMDSASKALLHALTRRIHQWPLLIIATSNLAPQKINLGNELLALDIPINVIPLKPLSETALRPLVGRGIPSLWTQRWLQQIHRETAGEPLSLTEKLDALRRKNLIDTADSGIIFPVGLLQLMTDPASTEGLTGHSRTHRDDFQQNWRALSHDEQGLMQKAAALRGSLTLERLRKLSVKSRKTFQRILEGLIRKEYLAAGGTAPNNHTPLSFSHNRLRHRTYQTITAAERIWYHRRIFELLKEEDDATAQQSTVQRTRWTSAVAFHAMLAEDWEAATRWSLRAAAAAQAISPGPEVVALYRQALRTAEKITQPTQEQLLNKTRWAFADALFHVGSYHEAIPLYEILVETTDSGNPTLTRRLVTMYLHLNRVHDAQRIAQRSLDRVKNETLDHIKNEIRTQGSIHLNFADIHYRRGEPKQAINEGIKALSYLKKGRYPADLATAHERLGLFYWDLGEYGHALKHVEANVALQRRLKAPELIEGLNQLGELYQDLFCTDDALKVHREALALALEHGRLSLSIEIWRNIGFNFIHQGRMEKGLKTLDQAWQQAQDFNLDPYWHEVHLRSLLEAKILAHRPDEVRALLVEYKQVLGPRETPFVTIFTSALAFLEGRVDEGEALLAQVLDFWQTSGRWGRASHVLSFVGKELLLQGYDERAGKYLTMAMEEIEHICSLVPAGVARQIRASRRYVATRQLLDTMPPEISRPAQR